MRWNPFSRLIESKKYKYARLIRSSFLERLTDTFFVFYGEGQSDLGVIDYFFPFARLGENIGRRMTYSNSYSGPVVGISSVIFLISALVLNPVKIIFAYLLSLSVIPLILAVHLTFKYIWRKMEFQIKNLTIHPVNHPDKIATSDSNKKMKLVDLKNFSFQKNIVRAVASYRSSRLSFDKYYPPDSVIYLGVYYAEYSRSSLRDREPIHLTSGVAPMNLNKPDKLRAIIEVNPNNWQGILAMLKTNTMWATTNLEDNILIKAEDAHEAIENQIKPALGKREFMKGMSKVSRNKSSIKKFVESPIYDSKVSTLISQFAGFPKPNNLIEKVRCAEEKRVRVKV